MYNFFSRNKDNNQFFIAMCHDVGFLQNETKMHLVVLYQHALYNYVHFLVCSLLEMEIPLEF